ncbi:MAG TPA: zinc dependent phospholipase C family protein [Terriglobales bacterium]|nr:zinc dependent phospholipase C family protein [Terriglobales bacterium]
MRFPRFFLLRVVAVFVFLGVCASLASAYSVLTHEQVVDLVWRDQLQPLLLNRFPGATPDDLRKAHAYAYGGSLIQDMGYYPFGNKYFSDLLHYVRTGDFVEAMLAQSSDLNEYAFALGALAHYSSDNCGHPAINQVVAISFPKLERKYGKEVTYADNPEAHIRTEFGFDMVQVAKNRYTSDTYHDFIGFEISKPLLERAFQQTYDMRLQDVIHDEDLAFGTFRRAISKIIPEMTKVALLDRRADVVRDTPNFNKKKFLYRLKRSEYEKEWGHGYKRPGPGARFLAFVLKIVPKFGPFKALAFQLPTTQTEDIYIKSINRTIDNYTSLLHQQRSGHLDLANLDFDTGRMAKAGEYQLADKTFARLLDDLAKRNFDVVNPDLRERILGFYGNLNAPVDTKKDKKAWVKTLVELQKLKLHAPDQPPVPAASAMSLDSF